MNKRPQHIVIMAGGIGSRLWPISTPECSKQFIDVTGDGKSLLQLTISRFLPICPIENIWIVTSKRNVQSVREQLPLLPEGNILAEPQGRNTAPCIGYACWKIRRKCPDANIVVTPSDAFVADAENFRGIINQALDFTENHNAIVTIGIKPRSPETGYGYICTESKGHEGAIKKVSSFKEKPDFTTAQQYLAAGNYLWNAGIFVWNMEMIMESFRKYTPNLACILDKMAEDFYTDQEDETINRLFPTCEKISIDYAIMEKVEDIYTIPADFGWSDLGSWQALYTILPKDEFGNAVVGSGSVKLINCHNCIVHARNKRKVVLEGLDGYIVAERDGQMVICRMTEGKRVQDFASI